MPTRTNYGITNIQSYVKGDENHNDTSPTSEYSITINKANSTNATLTSKTYTYDGSEHTITSSGGSGGTVKYSTDQINWSTSIPVRVNEGTTRIYSKVFGDENHSDTSIISATVTINRKSINDANGYDITFTPTSYIYSGNANEPTVTNVKDKGRNVDLVAGTDYTVSYENNVGAGTGIVCITGIGNYKDVNKTKTFTINKQTPAVSIDNTRLDIDYSKEREIALTNNSDISGKWVVTSNGPTYIGILKDDEVKASANFDVEANSSTTIKYRGLKATDSENTISVVFVPDDTLNYNSGETLTHTVTRVNKIATVNPEIIPQKEEYTGEPISITQRGGDGGIFQYSYSEVNAPWSDPWNTTNPSWSEWSTDLPTRTDVGVTYVKTRVIPDDNHFQTPVSESYSLVVSKRSLAVAANSKFKIYQEADPVLDFVYANNIDEEIPLFVGELAREKAGTPEGENVGTYKILRNTLDLADNGDFKADNYELLFVKNTLTIQRKHIDSFDASLSFEEEIYDGTSLKPVVTVKDENDVELVEDRDYEVIYTNNKNAGTATVTINGINNYIGTITKTFEITKKEVTLRAIDKDKLYKQADPQLTYVVDNIVDGDSLNDVTISREAGETAGTYAITVEVNAESNPNYDITIQNATFTLNPKPIVAKINVSESEFIYDGTERTPVVTVYDPDDDMLVPDTEYSVIYENNKDVGTGRVLLENKENGNYIVSGERNLVVGKRNVTLRAINKSKTYKEADPELTYVVDDIVDGESLNDVTISREAGETAGTYTISVGVNPDTNPNYNITLQDAVLTINPKPIEANMVVDETVFTYDGTEHKPNVTVYDPDDNDLVLDTEYNVVYTNNKDVGTGKVTLTNKENGNYIVSGERDITINKRAITVTADDKVKLYKDADETLTYSVENLVSGETLNSINLSREEGETVGNYTITVSAEENANPNYDITFVNGIYTINPKPITAIIDVEQDVFIYDGTEHIPAVTVYDPDDNMEVPDTEYEVVYANNKDAGTGTITLTDKADGNYIVSGETEITINKKNVLLRAENKFKTYKESDPQLTYAVDNIVDGENLNDVTISREEGETAGTYTISVSVDNNTNPNYNITLQNAVFTIDPKPITARMEVEQTVFTYDGTERTPVVTVYDPDDNMLVPDTEYEVIYTNNKDAGAGKITLQDKDGGNYIVNGEEDLTINKKAVTISAENKEKLYKQPDETLTYTVDGVVDGESITGITISRDEGEEAGTYTIAVGVDDEANPNYDITLVNGTYTINPKPITGTINAEQTEFTYDGTEHTPAITVYDPDDNMLVPDTEYNVIYANNKDVGTGTITLTNKENGNYIVSGETNITINKRDVTLRAENKEKLYKQEDPELTYAVDNIVEGESLNDVTISREAGETVGTYTITVGVDESTNPNYNITLQNATFTLSPKPIDAKIIVEEDEFTYDGTERRPLVAAFDPDDNMLVPDTEYEVIYTNNKDAGTGKVILQDKDGGNYIVSGEKILTISKKAVTISADNKEKFYKDSDETLTYTVDGVVDGESITGITISREEGETAGIYTITVVVDNEANPNYDITLVNGIYTIKPKVVTARMEVEQTEFTYDGTEHTPAVTVYDPDDNMLIPNTEYDVVYTDNKNVGTGKVTLQNKENGNYVVSGEADITINKKAITVTANNKEKLYKQADPELTYNVTGIIEGESLNNIVLTREEGEVADTYTITVNAEETANPNYAITFINGSFIIKPKPIVANIVVDTAEFTYDGTEKMPVVTVYDPDDNMLVPDTEYEVIYTGNKDVGTGKITLQNKENGNYIVSGEKDITISKKAVTITVDNKEKIYKEADETLTYTVTGLVDGESLNGLTISRAVGENVGTYAITAVADAEANLNYNITIVNGIYTINPKIVEARIDLDESEFIYNGLERTPTFKAYDPDDNMEIPNTEYNVVYSDNKNVGTGKVTLTNKDDGNYIVSSEATFVINKKDVTVTADDKAKLFDDFDPILTYTVEGLVDGESLNGIVISRDEGENAGVYMIHVSANEENPNYNITFVDGKFLINETVHDIVLSQYEFVYDGTPKVPQVRRIVGDTEVPLDPDLYTIANNINAGAGIVTIFEKEGGETRIRGYKTFTILKKEATITADNKEKIYGEADGELTYTVDGLIAGQRILNVSISREEGENAGEYVINVSADIDSNKNYNVIAVPGTYTIKKKNISADVELRTTEDITGFVYDGTEKKPGAEVYYKATNQKMPENQYEIVYDNNINAGTSTIRVTSANYIIDATKTFDIAKRPITVTANNANKNYNDVDPELGYTAENTVGDDKLDNISVVREAGEKVGEYTITASQTAGANSNYSITFRPGTFTITKNDLTDKIKIEIQEDSESFPYKEGGQKPRIKVYNVVTGEEIPSTEYDVIYEDNDKVGTATIKVTSKPSSGYEFTGEKKFNIVDERTPIIKGIKNGETYYGDTIVEVIDLTGEITVIDNGEQVEVNKNGKFTIKADNKEHIITIRNKVGNDVSVKVYVFKTYTVKFIADGNEVKTFENVKHGEGIKEIPSIPTKPGYDKVAPTWNKDVSKVESDLIVEAVYVKNDGENDNPTSDEPTTDNKTKNNTTPSNTTPVTPTNWRDKIKVPDYLINQTRTSESDENNTSIKPITIVNTKNNTKSQAKPVNVNTMNNRVSGNGILYFLFGNGNLTKGQLILVTALLILAFAGINVLEFIIIPLIKRRKKEEEDNDDKNQEDE